MPRYGNPNRLSAHEAAKRLGINKEKLMTELQRQKGQRASTSRTTN